MKKVEITDGNRLVFTGVIDLEKWDKEKWW